MLLVFYPFLSYQKMLAETLKFIKWSKMAEIFEGIIFESNRLNFSNF